MSYLIDTHVISELRRKTPDAGVVSWFSDRPAASLYVSVLTLGEIRKGIDGINDPPRQQALRDWLELDLPTFFTGRVLPIDARVADRWGSLVAAAGRPLAAIDSLLAATAIAHDLTLVTLNTREFDGLPVSLFNPWSRR